MSNLPISLIIISGGLPHLSNQRKSKYYWLSPQNTPLMPPPHRHSSSLWNTSVGHAKHLGKRRRVPRHCPSAWAISRMWAKNTSLRLELNRRNWIYLQLITADAMKIRLWGAAWSWLRLLLPCTLNTVYCSCHSIFIPRHFLLLKLSPYLHGLQRRTANKEVVVNIAKFNVLGSR